MPRTKLGPITLDAPERWTLNSVILAAPADEAPGKGMLTTKAVQPFKRNLITTLEKLSKPETLEAYVKRQVDGLKQAGVPRQEVGKPERVTLRQGVDGLLTEQVISGATGERVRQMQLVVIKDGVAYTAIASNLDGAAFEKHREEFKNMLLSFEVG